ncbi:MAG TPA: CcoQ/FixQ family Cbb3-type cytochrome c oxidase assembly chaperone [Chitinophagaceae bacterium]|jgi:hypothetical protein|nr:CcoQ/FixQ family Cbb3-type cytochrome c oxidase assembly chaperone [Chitinophagaceae bacterium]
MLKFIKQHAESISGIGIYPVISLLIFFFFFVGLLFYVKKMDKKKVKELKNLPLDEDAGADDDNHKTDKDNHLKHA